jgi:hypothetical protein
MSLSVVYILLWPTPGSPVLGLPACRSKCLSPLCLVSRLQRRTRGPENGSLATRRPSHQTPMSHGNQSIRLAARRSERNKYIRRRRSSLLPDYPQRKRGCLRQRFAARLALGCGGRKATAYAQMRELPDSSAPERLMNSRSGLKRRLSHQRHGFEIGMPPRGALCGIAEGHLTRRWRGSLETRPARVFGRRCGPSVLSGCEQGIQVAFSSRSMRRNISTSASAKLRTPGGLSWCRGGAVSGVDCRPGCRDMPLYATICRSLERSLLIFLRLGFFFASELCWRCASRAKLAREPEGKSRAISERRVGAQRPRGRERRYASRSLRSRRLLANPSRRVIALLNR